MKTMQLELTSNGKTLGSVKLQPATQLRLMAYAKTNKIDLIKMIDLAVRFTTAPEDYDIRLSCPNDSEIIELAAKMAFTKVAMK